MHIYYSRHVPKIVQGGIVYLLPQQCPINSVTAESASQYLNGHVEQREPCSTGGDGGGHPLGVLTPWPHPNGEGGV